MEHPCPATFASRKSRRNAYYRPYGGEPFPRNATSRGLITRICCDIAGFQLQAARRQLRSSSGVSPFCPSSERTEIRDVVGVTQLGETELQGEMHFDDASRRVALRRVASSRGATRRAARSTANFILVSPLDSLNAECKGRHYVSSGRNVLSQSETRFLRERIGPTLEPEREIKRAKGRSDAGVSPAKRSLLHRARSAP